MGQMVLIIEDDPLSAQLASLILDSVGCEVVIASSGTQGLALARSSAPAIILLDLMLPGLDGFGVLGQLRSDPETAGVPVVVVSSKSQPDDRQRAAELGATAYLIKPYRKAELVSVVQSLLGEAPD